MSNETHPPITAGMDVILPNGHRATVALITGLSALVRIDNASAWYELRQLTAVEP